MCISFIHSLFWLENLGVRCYVLTYLSVSLVEFGTGHLVTRMLGQYVVS